jgi:hypothetical protein
MDAIEIQPSDIDSFVTLLDMPHGPNCAVMKCRRRARVRIFFTTRSDPNQDRIGVCFQHAIERAAGVVGFWKFGNE